MYISDKARCELIPITLHVYPIKDYGAIGEGAPFLRAGKKRALKGIAKFVIVWAKQRTAGASPMC